MCGAYLWHRGTSFVVVCVRRGIIDVIIGCLAWCCILIGVVARIYLTICDPAVVTKKNNPGREKHWRLRKPYNANTTKREVALGLRCGLGLGVLLQICVVRGCFHSKELGRTGNEQCLFLLLCIWSLFVVICRFVCRFTRVFVGQYQVVAYGKMLVSFHSTFCIAAVELVRTALDWTAVHE